MKKAVILARVSTKKQEQEGLSLEEIQLRLIFEVVPEIPPSEAGIDADEICYMNPSKLIDSVHSAERRIYEYDSVSK